MVMYRKPFGNRLSLTDSTSRKLEPALMKEQSTMAGYFRIWMRLVPKVDRRKQSGEAFCETSESIFARHNSRATESSMQDFSVDPFFQSRSESAIQSYFRFFVQAF